MPRRKSKASKPEVAGRVNELLRIRLDGAAFHDCVAYAEEQAWNVSERQVGRYIAAADGLLVDRMERSRKRLMARAVAMREALAGRAINAADYRTALAVLDSLAKLQNLFTGTGDVKELVKLASDQAVRLRELEARLDAGTHAESPAPPERPDARPADGETPDGGGPDSGIPG